LIVLGIDVGTSSVKAALVDLASDCVIVASGSATYPIDHPEPGAAEIRADELTDAIAEAVNGATVGHAESVAGIGLSCLTPALCLLGATDQPLGAFRIHLDRRSRNEAQTVHNEVGAQFLAEVGTKPLPGGISAISWLSRKRQEHELPAQVRRYLHLNSWLALTLTGQTAFDPGNASFTGLWNTLADQHWSGRWCEYFGVEENWLPPVVPGNATVGGLRAEVAAQWGLPHGIPVKLGTADTSCGMIAADIQLGDMYHSVGTTQVLAALTDEPMPAINRLTRHFGVGTHFVQVAHNPVGGVALTWLRQLCFSELTEAEFFSNVLPQALQRNSAVRLDPPFLGGDRLQIEECRAAWIGLTLDTDRIDLVSAVLQAMRQGHDDAQQSLGLDRPFRRVVIAGGGADLVRRLIAKYDGADVKVVHDGAVRGAAKLFLLGGV
jgi:xylulokinase